MVIVEKTRGTKCQSRCEEERTDTLLVGLYIGEAIVEGSIEVSKNKNKITICPMESHSLTIYSIYSFIYPFIHKWKLRLLPCLEYCE